MSQLFADHRNPLRDVSREIHGHESAARAPQENNEPTVFKVRLHVPCVSWQLSGDLGHGGSVSGPGCRASTDRHANDPWQSGCEDIGD